VTYASMLNREMSLIDWGQTANEIDCKVRGLFPWPGTVATVRGETVKVLRVRAVEGEGQPGTLLSGARVACGVGAVELLEVQAPGKKAVRGTDFVNGARLAVGQVLA